MTASNVPSRHVEILAVQHLGLDVAVSGLARVLRGEGEDVRRDVGGEHVAGRTDALGRLQRLIARAGSDVEHAVAGPDLRHVEHDLGRGPEPRAQQRAPVVPGSGGGLPLLAGHLLVLDGIERLCREW